MLRVIQFGQAVFIHRSLAKGIRYGAAIGDLAGTMLFASLCGRDIIGLALLLRAVKHQGSIRSCQWQERFVLMAEM